MIETLERPGKLLDPDRVEAFVAAQLGRLELDGRTLCVVIPDGTRSCPLPLLLGAIDRATRSRASSCTMVIALGTHAAMDDDHIRALVGTDSLTVVNHAWWETDTFVTVGTLSAARVADLSGGLLDEAVDVRINRLVVESDVTLMVGPVFPHEVVGFSGGSKYLFPGLSGPELIDLTHWVGALLTSREIIGTLGVTPVRALVDAAAALVPGERHALCVVVDPGTGGLRSLAFGDPSAAWAASAEVSARTHITYLPAPVSRVLSMVPGRYEDLWTGAKGFYKVEPVVADGGEVVLFAPHITEIAAMHPNLRSIGYHCRDFFLARWEEYRHYPHGELAHATHLFGAGTYDPEHGEHPRVRVTLATGIPEEVVVGANLTYRDPSTVDVAAWTADPDALVVPNAGEVLYRLR